MQHGVTGRRGAPVTAWYGDDVIIESLGPRKGRIMPTESLSAPIKEFMRSCEVLLSPPVSRDTLTQDELEIIKMYLDSLAQRFILPPKP